MPHLRLERQFLVVFAAVTGCFDLGLRWFFRDSIFLSNKVTNKLMDFRLVVSHFIQYALFTWFATFALHSTFMLTFMLWRHFMVAKFLLFGGVLVFQISRCIENNAALMFKSASFFGGRFNNSNSIFSRLVGQSTRGGRGLFGNLSIAYDVKRRLPRIINFLVFRMDSPTRRHHTHQILTTILNTLIYFPINHNTPLFPLLVWGNTEFCWL